MSYSSIKRRKTMRCAFATFPTQCVNFNPVKAGLGLGLLVRMRQKTRYLHRLCPPKVIHRPRSADLVIYRLGLLHCLGLLHRLGLFHYLGLIHRPRYANISRAPKHLISIGMGARVKGQRLGELCSMPWYLAAI